MIYCRRNWRVNDELSVFVFLICNGNPSGVKLYIRQAENCGLAVAVLGGAKRGI